MIAEKLIVPQPIADAFIRLGFAFREGFEDRYGAGATIATVDESWFGGATVASLEQGVAEAMDYAHKLIEAFAVEPSESIIEAAGLALVTAMVGRAAYCRLMKTEVGDDWPFIIETF